MAKPLSACLYKTLTLMLHNLINHPNLMGARRSCGQFIHPGFLVEPSESWFLAIHSKFNPLVDYMYNITPKSSHIIHTHLI